MSAAGAAGREAGPRFLVAGAGNILRGDDGFGVAVIDHLSKMTLPPGVRAVETGIAGLSMVQEMMAGYDGLIIIDALVRGRPPGTVTVLEPRVRDAADMTAWEKHEAFSDIHEIDPSRVLTMARAVGCLPERTLVIGCEPLDCDELCMELSPPVAAAVPTAIEMVLQTLKDWRDESPAKTPVEERSA